MDLRRRVTAAFKKHIVDLFITHTRRWLIHVFCRSVALTSFKLSISMPAHREQARGWQKNYAKICLNENARNCEKKKRLKTEIKIYVVNDLLTLNSYLLSTFRGRSWYGDVWPIFFDQFHPARHLCLAQALENYAFCQRLKSNLGAIWLPLRILCSCRLIKRSVAAKLYSLNQYQMGIFYISLQTRKSPWNVLFFVDLLNPKYLVVYLEYAKFLVNTGNCSL